jgi:general secretion pathway protein C
MGRYVSWLANAGLLVLCCFLVANTANAVFEALLTPAPADSSRDALSPPPTARPWSERNVILTRNLFNSSLLAPPPPPPKRVKKTLEATKLPLSLLGTAASPNAALSWAAVEDQSSRRTVVVRVDEQINNKAKVTRIERKRIVLSENGVLRELVLADPKNKSKKKPSASKRRSSRSKARRPARTSRRPSPATRAPTPTTDVSTSMSAGTLNASKLFSDARILPKYDPEGGLVGMQVHTIPPGSPFEEAGLQAGDIITQLNGIVIDSPEKSVQVLTAVAGATELTIEVDREGGPATLNVSLPPPQ